MFCTNCGSKNENDSKFCIKCGNLITLDQEETLIKRPQDTLNENWWIRLLKVLYIFIHIPLLIIIPVVWNTNTESCYYTCSGSTGEAFWYSLLTLVIYMVIVRLIKLATIYIAMGRKPRWKKEFKKFF